jgi:hypothetical protein
MKKIVRFYATASEIEALKKHATQHNSTMSDIIRSKLFESTLKRKVEPIKRNAVTPKKTQTA